MSAGARCRHLAQRTCAISAPYELFAAPVGDLRSERDRLRNRSLPPTASKGATRLARAVNYLTLDTYNIYKTVAAPPAASRPVQRPAVRARSRRGAVGRHTRPLRALLPPKSVRRVEGEAPSSLGAVSWAGTVPERSGQRHDPSNAGRGGMLECQLGLRTCLWLRLGVLTDHVATVVVGGNWGKIIAPHSSSPLAPPRVDPTDIVYYAI